MKNGVIRFGPAGNSEAFYADGNKTTIQVPAWVKEQGLNAYEYQCGRGVRISAEAAGVLGAEAATHGVELSVHAPYYISLASKEPEKRENSIRYILESARAVAGMGGNRIVVHPGGLGGLSREEATSLAIDTLRRAQRALDDEHLSDVHICPETMGKINQLGNFEEILQMCEAEERFLPCMDFGHLNSRMQGAMNSRDAFAVALDEIHNRLGEERGRSFHVHFSKIAYTTGGEKCHLTFADTEYGPEPEPLMTLFAERQMTPTVICESAGTQAADARTMRMLYEEAAQRKKQFELA